MNDFVLNLEKQIEATGSRRRRAARVLAILKAPDSLRRTRQVEMMEAHCAAQVRCVQGRAAHAEIDWSKIDWAALFDTLIKLLIALLPLLIAL